jgi:hypothetical protein
MASRMLLPQCEMLLSAFSASTGTLHLSVENGYPTSSVATHKRPRKWPGQRGGLVQKQITWKMLGPILRYPTLFSIPHVYQTIGDQKEFKKDSWLMAKAVAAGRAQAKAANLHQNNQRSQQQPVACGREQFLCFVYSNRVIASMRRSYFEVAMHHHPIRLPS